MKFRILEDSVIFFNQGSAEVGRVPHVSLLIMENKDSLWIPTLKILLMGDIGWNNGSH